MGKTAGDRLTEKDKQENDSLVDLILRIPCPKINKRVPYLQEYGNLNKNVIESFERAIKAIENYQRKDKNFEIQDRTIVLNLKSQEERSIGQQFLNNEFFSIKVEKKLEKE